MDKVYNGLENIQCVLQNFHFPRTSGQTIFLLTVVVIQIK